MPARSATVVTRVWATADGNVGGPSSKPPAVPGADAVVGAATIRVPQSLQNFWSGRVAAPQSGHAAPSGRPH
jgi:hypothetical protein